MATKTRKDAYKLIHEGALALSKVEAAGMRIDVKYLKQKQKECLEEIKWLEKELKTTTEYSELLKLFGEKAKLTSKQQWAKVLYPLYKFQIKQRTPGGKAKLDESVLEEMGTDFCKKFLHLEKLRKLEGTYIKGFLREVVGEYIHPFFNLHTTLTFRSSSDRPNFQNVPVRNVEISKAIRSAVIPREGHVLVEIDYSALEFRIAACWWKDPAMVAYASDSNLDIHRDCAAEIWKCDRDEINKHTRYCGKNQFVFPQLYGDFYINCAKNCWESIDTLSLKVGDVPMKEWLAKKGIKKLGKCDYDSAPRRGTFEFHMKKVEETFYEWFPEFSNKKDRWWKRYQKYGWFDLMTGFRCTGVFKRNQVMNFPIQGPAFHLLLWSLTKLVRWLEKEKMRTKIIGQIHDSIVADVHKDELEDYVNKARTVMTQDIKTVWDWIITPMEVEVEVAEDNWFNKKEFVSNGAV
jgi:DNA polymerase-1